jgi:uncharacterized protein
VEARALTTLVAAVLPRAWRRDSLWHGEAHWRCVAATGISLGAEIDGADSVVVLCFGLLHDTRRENDAYDPDHGARAEAFAADLRAEGLLRLDDERFAALGVALRLHSAGEVSADPTIGACWDADRLHLPRVSIEPDPTLFSTTAARGHARLSAAAALREHGAPGWEELVAAVGGPEA